MIIFLFHLMMLDHSHDDDLLNLNHWRLWWPTILSKYCFCSVTYIGIVYAYESCPFKTLWNDSLYYFHKWCQSFAVTFFSPPWQYLCQFVGFSIVIFFGSEEINENLKLMDLCWHFTSNTVFFKAMMCKLGSNFVLSGAIMLESWDSFNPN